MVKDQPLFKLKVHLHIHDEFVQQNYFVLSETIQRLVQKQQQVFILLRCLVVRH